MGDPIKIESRSLHDDRINGRDSNDFSKPEIKETFAEQELKRRFKSMEKCDSSLVDTLATIIAISALLGAQGKTLSRKQIFKIITEVLEQTKINAGTYNSKTVWALAGLGAALNISLSGVSTYKCFAVVGSGLSAVPPISPKTMSNLLQPWSSLGSMGNAGGQALSTASQQTSQYWTSQRTIGDGRLQFLMMVRDKLKEMDGADARKAQENVELIMRIIQAYHDFKSRSWS